MIAGMEAPSRPYILATRRSPLALAQTELVTAHLNRHLPGGRTCTRLEMVTTGDRQRDWSLEEQGGKGLFTKELEDALLEGRADAAVHSAKDLPTTLPDGLALAGFLPRAPVQDVLVRVADVETPRLIATSSPRRRAQLRARFPNAEWTTLRGNVHTRLRKLTEGAADATILAAAGLARLGIEARSGLVFEPLDPQDCVPAAGQGAIALETRNADAEWLGALLDATTGQAVVLERAVLAALGGGCHAAVAVWYDVSAGMLWVYAEESGRHFFPVGSVRRDETARVAAEVARAVLGSDAVPDR